MDYKDHTIRLYCAQSAPVLNALRRDGVCFSKAEYVSKKYDESSSIFLTAYEWFARSAAKIVPPPEEAELPYWTFGAPYSVDLSGGGRLLTLDVPIDEVICFDLYDWNRILCMKLLPTDDAQERTFRKELRARGLTEDQVMLSSFYPELKAQIMESWQRLFRHHKAILSGDTSGVGGVQAALWQIKREWIISGL
ncbi:MAG: DUF3841 domain-containing protein [Oscillospiraceae bacterium]|nr:DUF3841 domain-containing protein [Oscillospiraceae bacterium]